MPVLFQNPGVASLAALTTMGLSAKEGDNPIGRFGTGFKYAIATLLRTGHKVRLFRGTEVHSFDLQQITERGQTFDLILLDGQSINATTMLGRDWELWQAFRELHSNALDEGGDSHRIGTGFQPTAGDTSILVYGEGFENTFDLRDQIFLRGKPLAADAQAEIHRPGRHTKQHLYYRGVRVADVHEHCHFTYNVTGQIALTEDRTLKDSYAFSSRISATMSTLTDENLINEIITAMHVRESYESKLFPHAYMMGESVFAKVLIPQYLKGLITHPGLRDFARQQVNRLKENTGVELSKMQDANRERAINFLLKQGVRSAEALEIQGHGGARAYIDGPKLMLPIAAFDSAATVAVEIIQAVARIEGTKSHPEIDTRDAAVRWTASLFVRHSAELSGDFL